MDSQSHSARRVAAHRVTKSDGNFEHFSSICTQSTSLEEWPHAAEVEGNILIYDGGALASYSKDEQAELSAEITAVLSEGPGVLAIRGGYGDLSVINRATQVFDEIIEREKNETGGGGDHFAKPGANDRIWNSLQKHCIADPDSFARYYSNNWIALVSEAWLGNAYQMTAQVNRVNPGGSAQLAHRDYHLGFMAPEKMEKYPAHVHQLSPMLTLQGAVAHCDMPIESGPTLFLPYSQQFREGYLAFGAEVYQEYFNGHHVQLPLQKGDLVFFNPALMHAAGTNRSTDIYRMANLLQVSSAFGRAMEALDRKTMCRSVYPILCEPNCKELLGKIGIRNVVAATAEGYSFPTNLDSDPPVGGLAPKSQADIMSDALDANLSTGEFEEALESLAVRQKA